MHSPWETSTGSPSGDLQMDELTARQLADELTTLASSMFGLLQPHPSADPAHAESEAAFETALVESMPVADPASLVSVAIPAVPEFAAVAHESWAPPEHDEATDDETADDEPATPPAALAVRALAVPAVPQDLDPLDRRASLTLLTEIAFLDE